MFYFSAGILCYTHVKLQEQKAANQQAAAQIEKMEAAENGAKS